MPAILLNPLVIALIEEAFKAGPAVFTQVIAALKKPDVTLAEVVVLFNDVKPYDYFGIPAVAPTA